MSAALAQVWAMPGFWEIIVAFMIAGIVRGFTGFGTALIIVPIAGRHLSGEAVIGLLALADFIPAVVLLPRARRAADINEVALLMVGAGAMVPLGLWALSQVDQVSLRWGVALIASVTLLAVASGWRIGNLTRAWQTGLIGSGAGFIGGLTALTGPVVVLFYLAQNRAASAIRANMILFLAALDLMLLCALWVLGRLDPQILLLAGMVSVPCLVAVAIGQYLFHEDHARTYRHLAMVIVAASILLGLPLWD